MYHLQTEILALDLPHRLSSLLPVHLVRFALQWAVFDFHADLPREFNVARPGQRNLHNLSSGCVAVCSRRLRLVTVALSVCHRKFGASAFYAVD
jgi:hypothetical protein